MKAIQSLMAIPIMLLVASVANAQDAKANLRNFGPKPKTETFMVYGECEMCKRRIENALRVDGIKSANWNVETKVLKVQYVLTADITGGKKIQQLVAAAGHDTQDYKAADSVYEKLPLCCHYSRKSQMIYSLKKM